MGIKTAINRIAFFKIGFINGCLIQYFAKDGEVRIFGFYFLSPVGHIRGIVVRVGIQTETIYTGVFDPPDVVLGEIILNVGVVLVHIGHVAIEPAVEHLFGIGCCSMRVGNGAVPEVGVGIFWPLVYPAFHGHIADEPMLGAYVVVHQILNDF